MRQTACTLPLSRRCLRCGDWGRGEISTEGSMASLHTLTTAVPPSPNLDMANEKHRLWPFLTVRIMRPFLEALLRLGSRCRRRDVDRAGARRVGWKWKRWFAAPLQEMDKVW
jgi:hypothetical protein